MGKGVVILGVGNILLSDEGVGVHLVRRLEASGLPQGIETVDGGTVGYELLDFVRGKKRLVVVDCLAAGESPGTIIRASPAELELLWTMTFSAHQTGLRELLGAVQQECPDLEVIIVGVVPETVGKPGMELSGAVAQTLGRLESIVLEAAMAGRSELAGGSHDTPSGRGRLVEDLP